MTRRSRTGKRQPVSTPKIPKDPLAVCQRDLIERAERGDVDMARLFVTWSLLSDQDKLWMYAAAQCGSVVRRFRTESGADPRDVEAFIRWYKRTKPSDCTNSTMNMTWTLGGGWLDMPTITPEMVAAAYQVFVA